VHNEDNIDKSPHAQLAKDIWDMGNAVVDKHPEAKLMMAVIWTPKPDDWPEGKPHASSHTAFVSGHEEVSLEDLQQFLQYSLSQLVNLYRKVVRRDPDVVDIMSKEK